MPDRTVRAMLDDILSGIDLPPRLSSRIRLDGDKSLPSCFPVSDLAAAVIGAASLAVSELAGLGGAAKEVAIDRRLASLWFGWSIRPQGWDMPSPWDTIAGDYRTRDGWIKLHTNAQHHRAVALEVLECASEREAVAEAVSIRDGHELEAAIIAAGGCAARLRGAAAQPQRMAGAPAR